MPEDAGSIYSEVRIKIDQLQKDIATAVAVMDRFGQKVVDTANIASNLFSNSYSKSIRQVESYVKSLDKAVTDGALTQRQAIASAMEARKAELAYIQATAAKKGGFTDQEIADLKRVKGELTSLTEQQKKLGAEVENTSGGFKLLALAASTAVIAMFRSLVTSTAAYSEALAGVQAATRGSANELNALAQSAEEAGKQVATSSAQSLKAIEALAKAGVSTADIMGGALPGALTLAAAGSMEVADAAEIAAATMTQFGLAGEDVVHIADLLAAGAGKAQGEVSDLSQALKQAGLVASQTGLSVDDTVGSLAAFASAGLLGSDAGTSFRTMLLRLTPQSKEAAEKMKELGINAFDAKGEFIGITKFAGQLQTQLKSLTTEQRNAALATVFGSDSIRAANVLYSQGEAGLQGWIDKVNDQGFAAETARIKLDNLAGDLKKLDAQVATSSAKIGGSLNPTLRGLAQAGTSVLDFLDNIPAPVAAFGVAAGSLAAGITALTVGIGFLTPALAALGVTVSAAFGPISLAVGAVAALTAGIVAMTNAVKEAEIQKAAVAFGDVAKGAGLSGEQMAKFAQRAKDAEVFLRSMGIDGTITAKSFEVLAKDLGLTTAQLSAIALRSDKVSESVKEVAKGFKDGKLEAAIFLAQQQKMWKEMDDYWAKKYPDAVKKATTETKTFTSWTKTLSEEIAFQNQLFARGVQTKEEELSNIIALNEKEIQRLKDLGAETGNLGDTERARILQLIANNEANKKKLEVIKKATEDVKKATEDKDAAEKKGRAAIAVLSKTAIDLLEEERDELLKYATEEEKKTIIDEYANRILVEKNKLVAAEKKAVDDVTDAEKQRKAFQDKNAAEAQKQIDDQIKANKKLADEIFDTFSGLAMALGDIFAGIYQRQIDDAERAYEIEREKIENNGKTKEETLEENLATAKETLKAETDASKIEGDRQAVADAQKALDLYLLEAKFTKKKADLEYEAALSSWRIQLAMTTAAAVQAALNAFSSTALVPLVGPALAGPVAAGVTSGIGALSILAVTKAKPEPPAFATGGIVLPSGARGKTVTVADNGGGEVMFGTGALGQPLMQGFADLVAARILVATGSAGRGNAGGIGGGINQQGPTFQIVLDGRVIAESTVNYVDNGIVKMRSLPR